MTKKEFNEKYQDKYLININDDLMYLSPFNSKKKEGFFVNLIDIILNNLYDSEMLLDYKNVIESKIKKSK